MNLKNRIERLERETTLDSSVSMPDAWNAPIRDWPANCICFPCKPEFGNECELEIAASLKCEFHGDRFSDASVTHRARWLSDWYLYDWPPDHVRPQYKKAWLASFPMGFLPVEGGFNDKQWYCRVISLEEWLIQEEEQDRRQVGEAEAHKISAERRKRYSQWLT